MVVKKVLCGAVPARQQVRGSGGRPMGFRVIARLWEEAVDAVRDERERGPAGVPGAASRGFSCQCGRAGSAIVRGFPAKLGSDRQGRINPSSVEGLALVPLV